MADNQYSNGSVGGGGLVSPFSNSTQGVAPFADEGTSKSAGASPFTDVKDSSAPEETSVWSSLKADWGARADAVAASILQDEANDKSRFMMRKAQKSVAEANQKAMGLTSTQNILKTGADIGTGLALEAIPYVGQVATPAYFGAMGVTDQLREQIAKGEPTDLSRAGKVGLLEAAGQELGGGLATKAAEYAAPFVKKGIDAVTPYVEKGAGMLGRGIQNTAEAAGHLVGGEPGRMTGRGLGYIPSGLTQAAGSATGAFMNQAGRSLVSTVGSTGGKAMIGGAGGGASMQMIDNLANGRPIQQGVGEAAYGGALGGAAARVAKPVIHGVISRVPTTLSIAKNRALGRELPKAPGAPFTEPPAPEEQNAQPTAGGTNEAGGFTKEQVMESLKDQKTNSAAPWLKMFTRTNNISGDDIHHAAQGVADAITHGIDTVSEHIGPMAEGAAKVGEEAAHSGSQMYGETGVGGGFAHNATVLWNAYQKEGIAGLVSTKGRKQMTEAELSPQALGVRPGKEFVAQARATEGALDVTQRLLENTDTDTPEFKKGVEGLVNLAMQSGSAAAHARANALAVKVEMPATQRFHDINLTEGMSNPKGKINVLEDVHGGSIEESEREHKALLDSEPLNIPFGEKLNKGQNENLLTKNAHFNETRDAYDRAERIVDNAMKDNIRLAKEKVTEMEATGAGTDLHKSAQDLEVALRDLQNMKNHLSDKGEINEAEMRKRALEITENATKLGLMDKLKSITGETGVFNPVLDMQAWENFNKRTRKMHSGAPKGATKETATSNTFIKGVTPSGLAKTAMGLATARTRAEHVRLSQAKGNAMMEGAANEPTRGPSTEESLKSGDFEGASTSAEEALKNTGIDTGDVQLGATPGEEIQTQQQRAMATPAQHAELGRRGHPAAGHEGLTKEAADLFLAHDDMYKQQQATGQMAPESNPEAVAQEAARPAPLPEQAPEQAPTATMNPFEGVRQPTRLGEPAPAEQAPETIPTPEAQAPEVQAPEAPQNAPEAPTELSAPFAGVRKPAQAQVPTEAPKASQAPLGKAPSKLKEGEPVPQYSDEEVKNLSDEDLEKATSNLSKEIRDSNHTREGTAQERHDLWSKLYDERMSRRKAAKAAQTAPAETPTEAPKAAPAAPAETPKAEEVVPKTEEEKAKAISDGQYTPALDEQIPEESTQFKGTGENRETSSERNKRVEGLFRKVIKKATSIMNKPKVPPTERNRLQAIDKNYKHVIERAYDIADRQQVERADVLTAIMASEGGIESVFRDGMSSGKIDGRIRTIVTAYRQQARSVARGMVNEAGEVVKKRLGEFKAGRSQDEIDDTTRANLKAQGISNDIIDQAFNRAKANTSQYTATQVMNHARTILRENRQLARSQAAVADKPLKKSRDALYKLAESLGADNSTVNALKKIANEYTNVGSGLTGDFPALSEAEVKEVIGRFNEELDKRVQDAATLHDKSLSNPTEPAPKKKANQERLEKANQARDKAKEKVKEVSAELTQARKEAEDMKKAYESNKKALAEAETKFKEMDEKIANLAKEHEANVEKAYAAAKADMRSEAEHLSKTQAEEFSSVLAEQLPESVSSRQDPSYRTWKAQTEVAIETLKSNGSHQDAKFMEAFKDAIELGLKRKEELPDHPNLTIDQETFNRLRDLYNQAKKGEPLSAAEQMSSQMGTTGVKFRTLLTDNGKNPGGYPTKTKLNQLREKVKHETYGPGEDGLSAVGLTVKNVRPALSNVTPEAPASKAESPELDVKNIKWGTSGTKVKPEHTETAKASGSFGQKLQVTRGTRDTEYHSIIGETKTQYLVADPTSDGKYFLRRVNKKTGSVEGTGGRMEYDPTLEKPKK